MKRILTIVGAFAGVGLLGFVLGFASQSGKLSAARGEAAACGSAAARGREAAAANVGLLELYRARAELARANFGLAADALTRAKDALAGTAYAGAAAEIDEATARVLKQEAASSDEIGAIIKSLEARGLPARVGIE